MATSPYTMPAIGIVAIRETAIAKGVQHVAASTPEALTDLGITPEHVRNMVEARFGGLLAADPSVSINAHPTLLELQRNPRPPDAKQYPLGTARLPLRVQLPATGATGAADRDIDRRLQCRRRSWCRSRNRSWPHWAPAGARPRVWTCWCTRQWLQPARHVKGVPVKRATRSPRSMPASPPDCRQARQLMSRPSPPLRPCCPSARRPASYSVDTGDRPLLPVGSQGVTKTGGA